MVVDGARGEGKGGTENQEINTSTETKGAAEGAQDTRPSSSDEAAHTSRSDQKVVRIAQGSFIVAKELAAVEEDGMEMMLGMLWMAYKPEQYYFDIINIMFKLVYMQPWSSSITDRSFRSGPPSFSAWGASPYTLSSRRTARNLTTCSTT